MNLKRSKSCKPSNNASYFMRLKTDVIRDKYLYLLLLPVIVWYIMFSYKPMLGLEIAFRDYSPWMGIKDSPFVGLDNFINFFKGQYFWRTLRNTLVINMYALIFGFPAPIILALLLNEVRSRKFKNVVTTIVYLPHFISTVVIVGIVLSFLNPGTGIINILIKKLGGQDTYFIMQPEYFRTIFTTMNVWKEVGFGSIIYVSAFAGIDTQLYEACAIDGGGKWRQLWHITLPGIANTVIIMLIMRIGTLLSVGYEAIILMYQPVTYETADVISTYVYRIGIEGEQMSMATAVGLFNSLVSFILVITTNYISKKYSEVSLW